MSDGVYLAAAKEVGGSDRIGCALIAIAESVAELVETIRAQALAPVERIAGPAVGEPLGYAAISQEGDEYALVLDYLERDPERAQRLIEDQYQRVVAVYDLPSPA